MQLTKSIIFISVITADTQAEQREALPDNPCEGGSTVCHLENRENLLTNSVEEDTTNDPWKPPDYDSVANIDQSFYGEINNPQRTVENPGKHFTKSRELVNTKVDNVSLYNNDNKN